MITLTTPAENGIDPSAPYTHAAIKKLDIDANDNQFYFVLGYGDGSGGSMVYSDLAPPRVFAMRNSTLREGVTEWAMPNGYYDMVLLGLGGPVLTVLEQRLVTENILTGTVS